MPLYAWAVAYATMTLSVKHTYLRSTRSRMSGYHSRDDGFSLMEISVVILIVSVLLSIAVASYSTATARVSAVTCENNRRFLSGVAVGEYQFVHADGPSLLGDLAPHVANWESVKSCPTDSSQLLFLDADRRTVVCPLHGK